MDLAVVLLGSLVISIVVLTLGALNYFLGRPYSSETACQKQPQSDISNQQQSSSNRVSSTNSRRKNKGNANKRRQRATAAAAAKTVVNDHVNSNNDGDDILDTDTTITEINTKDLDDDGEAEEQESSEKPSTHLTQKETDEDEEFQDPVAVEFVSNAAPPSAYTKDKQDMSSSPKQRNKDKSNQTNSKSQKCSSALPIQELTLVSKPQANVPPVKQTNSSPTALSIEPHQEQVSRSHGDASSPHEVYFEHHGLPPRFQQQQRDNQEAFVSQKFRRKPAIVQGQSPHRSANVSSRQNNHTPIMPKKVKKNIRFELPLPSRVDESSNSNGYSSGSDILPESLMTPITNRNHNFKLSTSAESQYSSKESDIRRLLSTSNSNLDKLVAIFDTVPFSSNEIELILKKLMAKQLPSKSEQPDLLSMTNVKSVNIIDRVMEEIHHNQAKILAIELQLEKSRVLELTRSNVELTNAARQLQQPYDNMASYQQSIAAYQMQLKGLTDENVHLAHQLHAYSMMPNTINELKQQQNALEEEIRQVSAKTEALGQEIEDGERAKKQAAEIYKKSDIQKQERIEQMMEDLNKYKKIEKEFTAARQKYKALKEALNNKLDDITNERDQLEKSRAQLQEKLQGYEQLKTKYDELVQNETEASNLDKLQQELTEIRAKHDILKQRNSRIMEQLNEQLQKRNQKDSLS